MNIIKYVLERKWILEGILIFLLFYISLLDDGSNLNKSHNIKHSFFLLGLVYAIAQIYRFLVFPGFFNSGRPILHFAIIALLILSFTVGSYYLDVVSGRVGWYDEFSEHHKALFFFYLLAYSFGIGITFLILVAARYYRQQKLEHERELKLKNMELSLIRNQFRPHFLFNTLNNLYGVSLHEPARVSELILKLSTVMRYQLNSVNKDRVKVEEVLDFTRAYVAVETERVSPRCTVKLEINVLNKELLEAEVLPMLYFNLIENAFKFGGASRHSSFVHISITLDKAFLELYAENTNPEDKSKIASNGTGIKSTTEMLELEYKNRYAFEINDNKDVYSVFLKIDLS